MATESEQNPTTGKDEHFLSLAIAEARRGIGLTSPNPPVGAVIVKAGKVLASGYHEGAGLPHAEVAAIEAFRKKGGKRAQARLKGATLYVTLEPCSTRGRTPPCTDAILEAKFSRVVFGTRDPNPAHRGRGVRLLRSHGVSVTVGVLEEECRHLIRMFRKFVLSKSPFVIAKCGLTLDGRITREKGGPQWITGPEARRDVQELRSQVDAILIGGETLRRDNPRLTLRGKFARSVGQHPWRAVMTRSGRLPQKSLIFNDKYKDRTLVFRGKSLRRTLKELARRDVVSVLLEAGGNLMGQAFRDQLVDEVQFYIAPRIGGGDVRAVAGAGFSCELKNLSVTPVGSDFRITAVPHYPNRPTNSNRTRRRV